MLELERLGVRVVSGRLGKGNDDEDGDDGSDDGEKSSGMDNKMMGSIFIEGSDGLLVY